MTSPDAAATASAPAHEAHIVHSRAATPTHPSISSPFFSYPPPPSAATPASTQRRAKPTASVKSSRLGTPTGARTPARMPIASTQTNKASSNSAETGSHAAAESSSLSQPSPSLIPGFGHLGIGLDQSASGSGGEKTLRHRVFPFHDLAAEGDPHRPMHRPVTNPTLEEQRLKNFHGVNCINEPFVHPKPMYDHPPPPRTFTELDRLLAPAIDAEPLSDNLHAEISANHTPRASRESALTASQLTSAKLRPASASPTHHRPVGVPAYDPSRAGWHSKDTQRKEHNRSSRTVPRHLHTGALDAIDFSARTATVAGGQMVPTAEEQHEMRARVKGEPFTPSSTPDRRALLEKRPGAKSIRDETVSLRRSDAVRAVLTDSPVASTPPPVHKPAMRLNLVQRQRDFGENHPYDIITLHPASTERAAVSTPVTPAHSSGPTAHTKGRQHPHHIGHLDRTLSPQVEATTPRREPRSRSLAHNDTSHDMWMLLSGR